MSYFFWNLSVTFLAIAFWIFCLNTPVNCARPRLCKGLVAILRSLAGTGNSHEGQDPHFYRLYAALRGIPHFHRTRN